MSLLAVILSYVVIVGSAVVKLPQILTVWRSRSVAGLAPEQFLMEQFCYVINIYYNLSIKAEFWTWGEVVFLFASNVVLLEQVVAYGGAETKEVSPSPVGYPVDGCGLLANFRI